MPPAVHWSVRAWRMQAHILHAVATATVAAEWQQAADGMVATTLPLVLVPLGADGASAVQLVPGTALACEVPVGALPSMWAALQQACAELEARGCHVRPSTQRLPAPAATLHRWTIHAPAWFVDGAPSALGPAPLE